MTNPNIRLVTPDETPAGTPNEAPDGVDADQDRHPLLVAGDTGDRLTILEASLKLTLESLVISPAYARSPLLGKVVSLTAEIDAVKKERDEEAEDDDAHAVPDEEFDAEEFTTD